MELKDIKATMLPQAEIIAQCEKACKASIIKCKAEIEFEAAKEALAAMMNQAGLKTVSCAFGSARFNQRTIDVYDELGIAQKAVLEAKLEALKKEHSHKEPSTRSLAVYPTELR